MQEVNPFSDLIGILAVLATAGTVIAAAVCLVRRRPYARRLLWRWGACAIVYVAVSLSLSAIAPQRSIGLNERWCSDDWCWSVDGVSRRSAPPDVIYTLDLHTYNDARLPEGARYPWMFLRDDQGHRYLPETSGWIAAIEARLPPHGSRHIAVPFKVPAGAQHLGFMTGHGSGRPCRLIPALLFAGQGGCLFHKYDSIRIS